jgi:sporulation protein YlmC with PRC-barrel domain
MRLKELRGLPVIDPTAARKIGTVVDYQVDPVSRRLAALDISAVDDSGGERVLAQRIRRVGSSAVVLTARGGAASGAAPEINERWLDTSTLIGLEVMGDDGNRIGHLVDATFDQDSLEVRTYVLRASFFERLVGRRGRIEPDKVHACSRELMIVTTGRVAEIETAPQPDETSPLDVRMPLKDADRLPTPSFEAVPDGQPIGSRRP